MESFPRQPLSKRQFKNKRGDQKKGEVLKKRRMAGKRRSSKEKKTGPPNHPMPNMRNIF
jgi:hypothetical protein